MTSSLANTAGSGEKTGAVVAVTDVNSLASIRNVVLKTVVPFLFISTCSSLLLTAVKEARTVPKVAAYGARNVTFAAPDVIAVVSSEHATTITSFV